MAGFGIDVFGVFLKFRSIDQRDYRISQENQSGRRRINEALNDRLRIIASHWVYLLLKEQLALEERRWSQVTKHHPRQEDNFFM
jgi:hypothetical protein